MTNAVMLTAYPFSSAFEQKLRLAVGAEAQVVSIAQLRSRGMSDLLMQLWSIKCHEIYLPIEEVNSSALLPVLKLVAAFTRARNIVVIDPDMKRTRISRPKVAVDALSFIAASLSCLWAANRASRELKDLLAAPRVPDARLGQNDPVLYLKTNLWFGIKAGGSVGHIAGVVNGLNHLGHPVTFASAEPPVMVDPSIEILDVRPPRAFGLPYELNNYRFQKMFEDRLEKTGVLDKAPMVYQRLSAANYLGAVLARRHKKILVVEYNGSEVWVAKHWGRGMRYQELAEMAEDAMLRHAHLVVTVSDVLRDELVERGVEPSRIVTYPNCIDPKVFNPENHSAEAKLDLRNELKIPQQAKVVTFVGTFGQWHGAEKLAEAIVRLSIAHADWLMENNVRFLFVGDGLTRPAVMKRIEDADAMSHCIFVGLIPQAQTPLYLAASDILVSPHVPNADGSRFFGSPTKLFEYMAMGKPILASGLEQIADVLQPSFEVQSIAQGQRPADNGQVALLAQPGDVAEIVTGLKILIEDLQLRDCLGKNSRYLSLNKYTWDIHVNEILRGLRA